MQWAVSSRQYAVGSRQYAVRGGGEWAKGRRGDAGRRDAETRRNRRRAKGEGRRDIAIRRKIARATLRPATFALRNSELRTSNRGLGLKAPNRMVLFCAVPSAFNP